MATLTATAARILPDLSAKDAEIAALRAQIEALRSRPAGKLTLRVSANTGCLCIYGLGARPISAYASQWERILGAKDEILAFIEAHPAKDNEEAGSFTGLTRKA